MKWQGKLAHNYLAHEENLFYIIHCKCENEVKKRIKSGKPKLAILNEAADWVTYLSFKENSAPLEIHLINSEIKSLIVTIGC